MSEICIEWSLEVDSAVDGLGAHNLGAQEDFVVDFIAPMFDELGSDSGSLGAVKSLHFTRIFNPERDQMGAYVRLRLFCAESDSANLIAHVDGRLDRHFKGGSGLGRNQTTLDWPAVCAGYGGPIVGDLFRDHLHRTSQTVCGLLVLKRAGFDVEPLLWPWTHFFFNGARGYGRSVLEIAPGAVTGFAGNV